MSPKLTFKLRLVHGNEVAMGPGKADLSEAIIQTGSISAAARSINMSHLRAWLLIEVTNRCFTKPVVKRCFGGNHGGGAHLTPTGIIVLAEFRKMEAAALNAAYKYEAEIFRFLKL